MNSDDQMPLPVVPHMTKRRSPIVGMEAGEYSDIALFRERVEKLATSQRKYQVSPFSNTTKNGKSEIVMFEANTPDLTEVENLALKFRFFYAEKEPTQFEQILTKVRRRTEDEWACCYMDWLAKQYKEIMKASEISADAGLAVHNRKIIDLWFNSEFFHSDISKREKLIDIHATIGKVPSLFQLYVAIVRCSSYIQMLYSVVHVLSVDHQFIYSPDHHFGRTA